MTLNQCRISNQFVTFLQYYSSVNIKYTPAHEQFNPGIENNAAASCMKLNLHMWLEIYYQTFLISCI